jgi:hypothetical protein
MVVALLLHEWEVYTVHVPASAQNFCVDGQSLLLDPGMTRATAIFPMATNASIFEEVTSWVRQHPLTGLGIAFGVGYLLGGGLFSRTTARLLGVGARVGMSTLARNLISQAV